MLRWGRGPLRWLWHAAYAAAVRAICLYLRLGARNVSVYVVGSLGRGDAVYGLSDLDVVAVASPDPVRPGRNRDRLAARRDRIRRALPTEFASDVEACEEPDLARALAETVLTHGLDDLPGAATILGDTGWSRVANLQERPGVGRPLHGWRRVAGPDRRIPTPPDDPQRRRVAAWLELQHWWRYAFGACLRPQSPRTAFLCVKLVSEAVGAWLWVERGEAVPDRRQALLRGLRVLPEEEPALRQALALLDRLDRHPVAPVAEALGALTRLTGRVAARLTTDAADAGATPVRLVGAENERLSLGPAVPLVNWRALVAPRLPEETLVPRPGRPDDPRAVADAAAGARPGIQPALRWGPLLVLPTADVDGDAILRGVQCPVSDPVSAALLDGGDVAAFPELRGWRAPDVARRAVAEHAAWLREADFTPRRYARWDAPATVRAAARLLTAARAALFAASLAREEPELALTASATASLADDERLGEAVLRARGELNAWYRERRPCRQSTVTELRGAVCELPSYRGAASPSPSYGEQGHRRPEGSHP